MSLAFSYVRFSSDQQAKGDSLRRQLKAASEYALARGLTLDTHTYRDLGVSAFKGRNAVEGALGAFIEAIDAGRIPHDATLLVESLDRLSRERVDVALELFLGITRRGVTIVTLMDGQVYSKDTIRENWTRLIIALAVMSRAHEESATKSRRVKDYYDGKRAAGKVVHPRGPSWLRLSANGETWDIIHEKAAVVNRIFDLAIAGKGQNQIMRLLDAEGVETMEGAKFWTQSVVGAILRNPAVYGVYTQKSGGRAVLEAYYTPIMSKQKFMTARDAINGRLSKGGTRKGVTSLFSGMSYCGYCGARMKYQPTRTGYAYLHCLTAYAHRERCIGRPFPYKAAEKAILDRLINRQGREIGSRFLEEQRVQEATLTGEIDTLKKKQASRLKVLDLAPDVEVVAQELNAIQQQIAKLEEQLRTVSKVPLTGDELDRADALFKLHQDMEPGPEREELRERMKVALNRQLRKVEFYSNVDEAPDGKSLIEYTRDQYRRDPRYTVSEHPQFIVGLTYAGGSERTVDATPFINARSKARREAGRATPPSEPAPT
jgi:DNA invertase Pin-like site-specific DNA recombinase